MTFKAISPVTLATMVNTSVPRKKPLIIGIYGLPGTGKSTLMLNLQKRPDQEDYRHEDYTWHEGSEVIAKMIPDGLPAFKRLDEPGKEQLRQKAIEYIEQQCTNDGRPGVVAGHFMLWDKTVGAAKPVYTQADFDAFTHIIYYENTPKTIAEQCKKDTKDRSSVSPDEIEKWQKAEITGLRKLCGENDIIFTVVSPSDRLSSDVTRRLCAFKLRNQVQDLEHHRDQLDIWVKKTPGPVRKVLIMDGDKTLAPADTGELYWEMDDSIHKFFMEKPPLETVFSSPLQYTYNAFLQAALLYEDSTDMEGYNARCDRVANAVALYREIYFLLKTVQKYDQVVIIVVTCGVAAVWRRVLDHAGLVSKIKIIGNGRLAEGAIVTPETKSELVAHLRKKHDLNVWAFGDSPLDIDMLLQADHSIVVVGEEKQRSKSMDDALRKAINDRGLQARQAILCRGASHRLTPKQLPIIDINEENFIQSIVETHHEPQNLQVIDATEKPITQLLKKAMRDASVAGPALRKVHRRVGWYLASEYLTRVIGLEEVLIEHVQGPKTTGHRLLHEQKTSIIAIMRGGEPMAFGVSDAFPLASFFHAKDHHELKPYHVQDQSTIILVDSVINTGKAIIEFVRRVRQLSATVRIVVVAGVVQEEAVGHNGTISKALGPQCGVTIVALRLSDNKYTGTKEIDTGNRLFNTTFLD